MLEEIDIQPHFNAIQHFLHHRRVARVRDALIAVVEVVVVIGEAHGQTADDEGGQLAAGAPPLLLAVSAHEGFVDVAPDERNRLFFQILRFARDFLALPLNDFARLIRLRHAPHGIKRVHVEGHMVQAILVFCQRRVREAVERGEAVGVLPNLLVVGVEDVRTVAVDGNTADVLGVDVARDVAPLVDYKHALAFFLRHLRERRAEQPRADDEIIILHILILLVDDTFR